MNWTEPSPPKKGVSWYDHVLCDTPLGMCKIEWKSWKESDSYSVSWKEGDTYSVTIGDDYIGEGCDLSDAKELAKSHLAKKRDTLIEFLKPKSETQP